MLEELTWVSPMGRAYATFWRNVKQTVIACTPHKCCILYGANPETHKLYGVLASFPYGHSHEELVRRYGVPGRPI